ncbi:DUF6483 family protein [Clostridium sp.]|uniref:DUF6483 family protein n=1 Tax=Clostridium sp. TaxID=1506 RepID=UPI0026356525|nr:DUF6483 family protein [Clostridium sp.]
MYFEKDYIKRLITAASNMLIAITSGKDAVKSNIEDDNYDMKLSEDDLLEIMIRKYLEEGKINKAENLIFDSLESHVSKRNYEIALKFYDEINNYSDERLDKCNFSRKEIIEGLEELKILGMRVE